MLRSNARKDVRHPDFVRGHVIRTHEARPLRSPTSQYRARFAAGARERSSWPRVSGRGKRRRRTGRRASEGAPHSRGGPDGNHATSTGLPKAPASLPSTKMRWPDRARHARPPPRRVSQVTEAPRVGRLTSS
ncbi:hypothetical protein AKJ09_08630 [Labilithrix luteola]|uniref:Uncharacterized protein n=1 Tax=Labilithrix luteola TaxID=1391654 RepID=A0A0K1Q8H8_9BACT|nr:hypothetical protein AKJ09_08630 [Labilithrix luteola]